MTTSLLIHLELHELHNNNNNIGFIVRFGVRRRHRGPPFAMDYHQYIIGGNPRRRGKEGVGTPVRSNCFHVSVRVKKYLWWEKVRF